ncbi:phage shock protein A (PspA) family protein [Paenimyroides aquimaris]|uniref:Phage shock protein A (PspA) family protein n=1 Tax=Paenimyroides marinum TaxID=1159016 RepID=A0A1H6KY24_9FLAO|nr:PspA/IM30 family protein [Paenimyroides aquimaris]SEH80704.1 phage shock protein A (PspA) family protein [Paenimyroides aquimaris]
MNIFKRIFRIGQAEIHAVVDKMEDPIKMTEQGIREMKEDLDLAMEAYAKVKALAIRTHNAAGKKREEAADYENKAVLLLQKLQKQELETDQAERLAKEALHLKKQSLLEADELSNQADVHDESANEVHKNIEVLKYNINKWETELTTIKARVRVANATKGVNKQLAKMDANSTISMLERMKEKVEEDEALAKAYGEMAQKQTSVSDEIDQALNENADDADLEALKKQLGM